MIINNNPNNYAYVYRPIHTATMLWHIGALLKWTQKEAYYESAGCTTCGESSANVLRHKYLITEDILCNPVTPFFINNEYVLEKELTDAEISAIRNAKEDYYGEHPHNQSMRNSFRAVIQNMTRHFRWSDDQNLKTVEQAARDGDLITPDNPISPVPKKKNIEGYEG